MVNPKEINCIQLLVRNQRGVALNWIAANISCKREVLFFLFYFVLQEVVDPSSCDYRERHHSLDKFHKQYCG